MQPPRDTHLAPDSLFHGRYRVVRCIKAGGMGAVYEVEDQVTQRQRALKVMLPQALADEDLRRRFAQEARITGTIESDHIAQVTDAGIDADSGIPFLVMDLLRGEDLGALSARAGPLPHEDVVLYLQQVALALDKTHAADIVHRDLKPENLYLTQRDDGSPCVKILDFGIAKLTAHTLHGAGTAPLGTPLYMAPEQIRGDDRIDLRADIYAIGHVAYTLLVGSAYWMQEARSNPMLKLFGSILAGLPEPPSVRARRQQVTLPSGFDAWFARATAPSASERMDRATTAIALLAEALRAPAAVPCADPPFQANVRVVLPHDRDPGKRSASAVDVRTATQAAGAGSTVPHTLPPRRPFVGREAELNAVQRALEQSIRAGGLQCVSLYGLGGMGKTALALEYAHQHLNEYPGGVWWVRAQGTPMDALVQLGADLRRIGPPALREVLAREPPTGHAADIARATQIALQSQQDTALVVLDNLDCQTWRDHLPGNRVRLIVTTRDKRFAIGERVLVEALPDGPARALAHLHAGEPQGAAEARALDRVLLDLSGLAVAVEVAAKAVRAWFRSWLEYERCLHAEQERLLEDSELLDDYPRNVLSALDLSIDRCGPGSAERALLFAAAVFAPDAVPFDWAAHAAALKPVDLGTLKAREVLSGLGLISVDTEAKTCSMHRLVHGHVRRRAGCAENEEKAQWLEANRRGAEHVAAWLIKTVDPTRMNLVDELRPHVEEALRAAERAGCQQSRIEIADRLATHFQYRAHYEEAQPLFELALRLAEQLEPPKPAQIATCTLNLSLLLQEMGHPAEARPLLERSLEIARTLVGPDHPKIAVRLANLGVMLLALGLADEARLASERALSIFDRMYGQRHRTVATTLSNLGAALLEIGGTKDAEEVLEESLRIAGEIYGPQHPKVATGLVNLARAHEKAGDLFSAWVALQQSLEIDVRIYGSEHPKVRSTQKRIEAVRALISPPIRGTQSENRAEVPARSPLARASDLSRYTEHESRSNMASARPNLVVPVGVPARSVSAAGDLTRPSSDVKAREPRGRWILGMVVRAVDCTLIAGCGLDVRNAVVSRMPQYYAELYRHRRSIVSHHHYTTGTVETFMLLATSLALHDEAERWVELSRRLATWELLKVGWHLQRITRRLGKFATSVTLELGLRSWGEFFNFNKLKIDERNPDKVAVMIDDFHSTSKALRYWFMGMVAETVQRVVNRTVVPAIIDGGNKTASALTFALQFGSPRAPNGE